MDYYKILNKEECHYGLQYRFGLNIDPIKFNPRGTCEPGGIYFSREDILAFLNYGPWIRKVTLPDDVRVYENPSGPRKWKADKVILGKKEKITAKVIKRLIDEGANPKACNRCALLNAAEFGHLDIVKLLLPYSDPKACDSYALRYAATNGYLNIVKLLIPVSDPKAYSSCALRNAALNGHLEIVKLLLPVSDPKAYDSYALRWAARNGHLEIVKLLLPISDPKVYNSEALRYAAENGHLEIVKLLIPVSEIDDYIIEYCKKYCRKQEILDLIISNKKEA
ncbi:MAG: ankyrin repeat domain-containing protein, partial [Sphaerochaetaceae bacterium]|nr:ankyrin repeat domain-containing protein [Sphaerochaetaceae bacterium]